VTGCTCWLEYIALINLLASMLKTYPAKRKKNVIHGYLEDGCKMNTILNYPPHFMNVNHKNMIEMVNFCRYLF
jgi:hypothetical protein